MAYGEWSRVEVMGWISSKRLVVGSRKAAFAFQEATETGHET
jgi:hypothetical protein